MSKVADRMCLPCTADRSMANSDRTRYVWLRQLPSLSHESQVNPEPVSPNVPPSDIAFVFFQNDVLSVSDRFHTIVQPPVGLPLHDGSITTGKLVPASDSIAGSGVRVRPPPPTATGIARRWADRPGGESHIWAGGAVSTAVPA